MLKILSTNNCPVCVAVKNYLGDSVEYVEIKREDDPDRFYEELDRFGLMSVPVLIKGDEYVVGMNIPAINKLVLG